MWKFSDGYAFSEDEGKAARRKVDTFCKVFRDVAINAAENGVGVWQVDGTLFECKASKYSCTKNSFKK